MTAERLRSMDDEALGAALGGLDLRWPAAPEVTGDVLAAVRATEHRPSLLAPRLSSPSRRRVVLLVAAAILALAAAGGAAKLVLDLGAVTIERIPGRPTAPPGAAFPDGAVGEHLSLEEAEIIVGFAPALPSALGPPDRVWVQEAVNDGTDPWLGSAWASSEELPAVPGTRWGAVLLQFTGDAEIASKQLFGETGAIHVVEVRGAPAYWITGTHTLELQEGDEVARYEIRGDVLLWQAGDVTFRLETSLPRSEVLRIANSIT